MANGGTQVGDTKRVLGQIHVFRASEDVWAVINERAPEGREVVSSVFGYEEAADDEALFQVWVCAKAAQDAAVARGTDTYEVEDAVTMAWDEYVDAVGRNAALYRLALEERRAW